MGEYRGIERAVQGETAISRLSDFLSATVIAIWRVKSVFLLVDEVCVLGDDMFGYLRGQVNEIEVVAKLPSSTIAHFSDLHHLLPKTGDCARLKSRRTS